MSTAEDVTCAYCRSDTPHLYHWYDHCTCAAGGAYEDHSSHCGLYGVKLIFNDSLLSASRRARADQEED